MSVSSKINSALAGRPKQDSTAAATRAKATIRRNVLNAIGAEQAHIFDVFAGAGHMYREVWSAAASCVGCDLRFYADERVAFAADNRRVLRTIDLSSFNIFDFDSYGGPWEQLLIVIDRRPIKSGERFGLVLTKGRG